MMFAFTNRSHLEGRLPQKYLTIFGLACWVIAYTFVWDKDALIGEEEAQYHRQLEEDAKLMQHYHIQLDAEFRNFQQASSSNTQVKRSLNKVSPDSISKECKELDVTSSGISKSRISGNTERWHRVVERMKDPDRVGVVKIAILGGSVPAGHECASDVNLPDHECAWPARLEAMLHESSMHNVEITNLARGGTPSSSGVSLVMELVDYDAIIIQWTTNDDNYERFYADNPEGIKPAFETLIRTALALPKNPAVILFEGFGMRRPEPTAESMHLAITSVYDIPVISARAAFWHTAKFHEEVLHGKTVHMKAPWHQRFACLMYANWIQESESGLDMSDWTDALDQPPVFGGTTLECKKSFSASAFSNTLEKYPSQVDGWSYYADVPNKYGFISNTTNSTLSFDVAQQEGMRNELYIHFLRSYSPEWGTARVEVLGERSQLIDSRTDAHESQLAELKMMLRDSDKPYKVSIRNNQGKVKIVELVLFSCKKDQETATA